MLTAEFAEIDTDAERNVLLISMTNGVIERGDSLRMDFPDTEVIEVPLSAASRKAGGSIRPADTALRRISGEIVSQRAALEDVERQLAADAAYQLMTGDFAELNDERWSQQHAAIAGGQARLARLHTEPWRRWANGNLCSRKTCAAPAGSDCGIRILLHGTGANHSATHHETADH